MKIEEIRAAAQEVFEEVRIIRRKIHRNPELAFKEIGTSALIRETLSEMGVSSETCAGTGVVATIGSGEKCLAFRADMDALPIQEETGLEFASQKPEIMHACGHDMHVAVLLGAAKIFKKFESQLNYKVKLLFQPSEEKLPGGAKKMIEEGALENPRPIAVYGQHVSPELPVGKIAVKPGPIMAAPDELYWTIRAKGAHAAQPQRAGDAILAAAKMIDHFQSIISKTKDPVEPGVLSVTAINGGTATNIFPEKVELKGTLRSFDETWREATLERIGVDSRSISKLYGAECDFDPVRGYPPTTNDEEATFRFEKIAALALGDDALAPTRPFMWGEDFGYYAQEVPSVFWFIGARSSAPDEIVPLHNPKFSPDESALITGTTLFAALAFMK